MAIKGLTTQKAVMPPIIGKLRKGDEKPAQGNKPGADLQYFRFTPKNEKDAQLLEDFRGAYGDEPQRIEIYLPSDDVDLCFDAWQEEWSASELKHRCDGEYIYERDRATGDFVATDKPCPYAGQDKKGCKQIGRLAALLPELVSAGHYGIVTVETHSINDIVTIHRALTDFKQRFGRLTGVPFYVYRYPENISTPSGSNGGRARREKWLVGITPATEFVQKQLEMARQHALGVEQPRALLVDSDTGEVIDGESNPVEMMDADQWASINALGKTVYRTEWIRKAPVLIYEITKKRTETPREMTKDEARQLFDKLDDENARLAIGGNDEGGLAA